MPLGAESQKKILKAFGATHGSTTHAEKPEAFFRVRFFLIRVSFALSGFTRIKNTRGGSGFAVCVFDP
jgi:hypothetical protein